MTAPAKVWPPGYKPAPLEVKDSLVEDEALWRADVGIEVDVTEMERDWRESLESVAAHEREAMPEPPPPAPLPIEETPAGKMAADMGYVLERRELTAEDLKPKKAAPYELHSAKARGMSMRVNALMQTDAASGVPLYPQFAIMIQALKFCYENCKGEFVGKSRMDQHRIIAAEMEKICDLSKFETSLGEWF